MYSDIPTVTRCCFCVPLRYGLLVWAYIKLVITIAVLAMTLLWMQVLMWLMFVASEGLFIICLYVFNTVMLLFEIIFNIVFIVGLHKKNTTLIRLYSRYGLGFIITEIIFFLIAIVYTIVTAFPVDYSALKFIIFFTSGFTAILTLYAYILILIRSELRKLKSNTLFKFENHTAEPVCVMQPAVDNTKEECHKEDEINKNTS